VREFDDDAAGEIAPLGVDERVVAIPNRAMAAAVESTVDGFGGAWGFGGGTVVVVVDPALLIGLVVDAALLGDAAIVVVVVVVIIIIDPVVVTPNAVGPFPCCKPANGSSGS
jgi:hypothetical protein